jgi:hypothetical protein
VRKFIGMNEYTFNPEHGEVEIHESPLTGIKSWQILLNAHGLAFLRQYINPLEKIRITGEIEGEAYFTIDRLQGSGPLIKNG